MSKQTQEAVDKALRDHLNEIYPGTMLTDWVCYIAGVDGRDERTAYARVSEGSFHSVYGLTKMLGRELDVESSDNDEDD